MIAVRTIQWIAGIAGLGALTLGLLFSHEMRNEMS
jgi:hypothetical protein